MSDYCTIALAELQAMTDWSQARDQLCRQMWRQGCVAELTAAGELPASGPAGGNWAQPQRWPPAGLTIPGSPGDRGPPEY